MPNRPMSIQGLVGHIDSAKMCSGDSQKRQLMAAQPFYAASHRIPAPSVNMLHLAPCLPRSMGLEPIASFPKGALWRRPFSRQKLHSPYRKMTASLIASPYSRWKMVQFLEISLREHNLECSKILTQVLSMLGSRNGNDLIALS